MVGNSPEASLDHIVTKEWVVSPGRYKSAPSQRGHKLERVGENATVHAAPARREQGKACFAISLSFDEFQLGHVSFDHAVIDPPGEAIFHGIFVFFDSSGKRLEFR